MKVTILIVTTVMLFTGLSCELANAQWRTPPIKIIGSSTNGNTQTVSCDLVNNSGSDLNWNNLLITVETLEGDESSIVVQVTGPVVVHDGRGFRGSSPAGTLPIRTVYCELDKNSVVSTSVDNLLFTMTVDDIDGKAVTTATSVTAVTKFK